MTHYFYGLANTRQTLVQTACKDIKLTVYNDGAQEVTITPENDLADSITQLIKFIGWSPDCPDATQLDNYVSSLNAEELLGDVKVFTVATGQRDYVANAANVSSIIWHAFLKVNRPLNWVGFYFVRPLKNPKSTEWAQILILGPFLGKPACSRIRYENGVCGASWRTKSLQRVANVHTFPGHIACDDASKSELVVPILNHHGEVVALIDLDCPKRDGFSIEDEHTFKQVAQIMSEVCDWENMNWPYVQS